MAVTKGEASSATNTPMGAPPRPGRVVGPIRAVLAERFQTSWNRSARELGKRGRVGMIILLVIIVVFVVLPVCFSLVSAGYFAGSQLDSRGHWLLPFYIIAGLLAVLSVGGAVLGGVLGGAQQLRWEQYRGFPVRMLQLFVAELVAGLGDVLNLALTVAISALLVGFAIGRPSALPVLPIVWVEAVTLMLTVQLLFGAMAETLAQRLRIGLAVVGGLLWAGSVLAKEIAERMKSLDVRDAERLADVGRFFRRLLFAIPTTWSLTGLVHIQAGSYLRGIGELLTPALVLVPLAWAAANLMHREHDAVVDRPQGQQPMGRLWSFRSAALGVARLQWETLLASNIGRLGLVIPLVTLVLLRRPFASGHGAAAWAVPGAFSYVTLTGNQLLFNQFGLDGHGVKGLFLLPLSVRDLMRGKLLGYASYAATQAALLLVLLALFERPTAMSLVAGVLLGACQFSAAHLAGTWMSALQPRLIPRKGRGGNPMPLPAALLSLGVGLGCTAAFGGVYALTAWLAPIWLVPVMTVCFAGTRGVAWLFRAELEAYWAARQEAIVAAMG